MYTGGLQGRHTGRAWNKSTAWASYSLLAYCSPAWIVLDAYPQSMQQGSNVGKIKHREHQAGKQWVQHARMHGCIPVEHAELLGLV